MRVTIRFNEIEELRLQELGKYLHEEDISKIVKFGIDAALHHIKFVTQTAINPDWEVIFQRKRKTMPLDRKIF